VSRSGLRLKGIISAPFGNRLQVIQPDVYHCTNRYDGPRSFQGMRLTLSASATARIASGVFHASHYTIDRCASLHGYRRYPDTGSRKIPYFRPVIPTGQFYKAASYDHVQWRTVVLAVLSLWIILTENWCDGWFVDQLGRTVAVLLNLPFVFLFYSVPYFLLLLFSSFFFFFCFLLL
jgi:hypothetical protein